MMEPQRELFSQAPEIPVEGRLICGIDNGLGGGIVLLSFDRTETSPVKIVMPTIKLKVGRNMRRYHNEPALRRIFDRYRPFHVFIEQLAPMPDQAVFSTSNAGVGHGLIRGILVGLEIPYTLVHPKTWQAALFKGMDKGIDSKSKALIICHRLWPGVEWTASERSRAPHDGLCDAALIGEWGRREFSGHK